MNHMLMCVCVCVRARARIYFWDWVATLCGGWGLLWLKISLLFLLVKHGGDVNATDNILQTALHWAAVRGAIAVADVLLQNGARVEAADFNGYRVIVSFSLILKQMFLFLNLELVILYM